MFSVVSGWISTNVIILLLAQGMGMYFISTILLIRMSLPFKYRLIVQTVLGDIEYAFYHRWFDAISTLSSLVTVIFFYILSKSKTSAEAKLERQWR
jgi:golgi pH regulator